MYIIALSLIILIDQVSKYLIRHNLALGESLPIIKNIFHLSLVHNTGAAFGMFRNQTVFFILAACITIIAIIINLRSRKLPDKNFDLERLSLVLVLSGAVGNLIDRIIFGYVVDFIDLRIWPVFNAADSSISIGAVLLVIAILKETKQKA
ncbi:MAG: signal peptidase II [Candidatus Omnitrophota bacterium]